MSRALWRGQLMADEPLKQWFSIPELALHLQLGDKLLREYIKDGFFPAPVKLSKQRNAYHRDEIPYLLWIVAHRERFRKGEEIPEEEE